MKLNKKGSEKYYIIVSLIIGLLVVGIILYWLFHEYFTVSDIDRESCSQSIYLRANAPEIPIGGNADYNLYKFSLKDKFPLKCKTEVININFANKTRAERVIANALAECWYLAGEGNYKLFPSTWISQDSACLVCSRIHISPELKQYYTDNPISFRDALVLKYDKDKTYYEYIHGSIDDSIGKRFFDTHMPIVNLTDRFDVVDTRASGVLQWARETAATIGLWTVSSLLTTPIGGTIITYAIVTGTNGGTAIIEPRFYNVSRGDLFIVYSSVFGATEKAKRDYLVYLQKDDFENLDKEIYTLGEDVKICGEIESVPA